MSNRDIVAPRRTEWKGLFNEGLNTVQLVRLFRESTHWIAGTTSFSRDLTECTEWVAKKGGKISAAITAAEQEWETSGDLYQNARMLAPEDGRTKKDLESL